MAGGNISIIESAILLLLNKLKKYRLPFISAVIVGFIAHGFSFSSKLIQQDDLAAFFSKGSSLTAGRFMLEKVLGTILPDYSMPWIYGILSLIFIAVSACLIIKLFNIRTALFQIALASLFAVFPTITGLFTMPFLSAANTLAICFSVAAASLIISGRRHGQFIGVFLIAISLGIYQAYITLSSSLMILIMLKQLLFHKAEPKKTFFCGVKYVSLLIAALALYGTLALLAIKLTGTEVFSYAVSSTSYLTRFRVAYTAFIGIFIKGYQSIVNSSLSFIAHTIAVAISGILLFVYIKQLKNIPAVLLSVLLIILLPLSINAFYLASVPDVLSAPAFMSFYTVYILAFVLIEQSDMICYSSAFLKKHSRGIVLLCSLIVIASNIVFSNKAYLKMYMQTQEVTSFLSGVMSNVMGFPAYDGTQKLAVIGSPRNTAYHMDEIDMSLFTGLVSEDPYDLYTRDDFIKLYLGYDVPFASPDEKRYLIHSDIFDSMPVYPAPESIQPYEDYVIVKLG